jgi:hypothetical protein
VVEVNQKNVQETFQKVETKLMEMNMEKKEY